MNSHLLVSGKGVASDAHTVSEPPGCILQRVRTLFCEDSSLMLTRVHGGGRPLDILQVFFGQ